MSINKTNIPLNWQQVKLADVCNINPSLEKLPDEFFYINLESVKKGILTKKRKIKLEGSPSRAKRLLRRGDILFQMVRPYQKNNLYFDRDENHVASTGYAQIRSNEDTKFLYYTFHLDQFVNKVLDRCTGSNYPAINSTDLSKIKFLLPPLPEQHRIVTILETWDKAIDLLTKKIKLKKQLKKGLMQKLLTSEIRLPGFSEGWNTFEFNNIFNVLKKPKGLKINDYMQIGTYPVLDQSANKLYSGYVNSKECVYDYSKSPVILFGDHSRVIKYINEKVAFGNDGIKLFENKKNLDINFGFYLLKNKKVPETGYNRHFKYLDNSSFEIPSMSEQKAIANILSSTDQEITLLQQKLDEFKKQKKYLLNNLVMGKIRTPENMKITQS